MNGPERVTARYLKKAGGSEFSVYAVGTDAKSAFQKAVSEARHERGSGGYSGTIAEKDSFKLRSSDPMTRAQARAFMEEDIEWNDKWGPAFAVSIAEEKVLGETEFTLTVKAKDGSAAQKIAEAEVLSKSRAKAGTTATVEVRSTKKLTEGGAVKVSFNKTEAATYYQHSGDPYKKYADKKQALEAAAKVLNFAAYVVGKKLAVSKVEVFGHVVKDAEPAKLPTWEVKGVLKQVAIGPVKGYLFYGMASS